MADEPTKLRFERDKDFVSSYANNVQFESTAFDLTLILGQIDQSVSPFFVRQRNAVTLSWSEIKLVNHFLQVNLAIHEAANGSVGVRKDLIPPPFNIPAGLENDPEAKIVEERVNKLREDFIASLEKA